MSDPKIPQLSAGKIRYSSDQEDVISCHIRAGLLVCAFRKGKAGAFYLAESDFSRLVSLLGELIDEMGSGASVKLVGKELLRAQARQWLRKKPEVSITGDVDSSDFEAFIIASAGRVRIRQVEEAPSQSPAVPVRVLIVDDSKTIRTLLRQTLSSDPSIEVVGEAERPSQVEEMIEKLKPTVITLDINMPEMDGVTLLQKYFPKYKIPTVMVTAISLQEGDQVLRALNIGAVDYIQKPSMEEMRAMAPTIIEKIKVAASVNVKRQSASAPKRQRLVSSGGPSDSNTIIAIGSSTGGVQALEALFGSMPEKIPPVVVVQHIPPVFSAAFAKRLNDMCPFEVLEAKDGDEVKPGRVLIAPGGTQMRIERHGSGLRVKVYDGAPVNRHKPSVDVLFDSVAEVLGKKAIGVILTGMGADGAEGLLKMKKAGAHTVAQDKDSCVVFGMPRAAIERGAAEEVKPLQEIPETLLRWLVSRKVA